MEDIVLVGFGGHAKSVADAIERQGKYHIVGYTDLKEHNTKYEYLGQDSNLNNIFKSGTQNACISIGYLGKDVIREELYSLLKDIGFKLPIIVDPSSVIAESAVILEGTFVGKLAVINAEAKIGRCCIVNTRAIVEHEAIVEDFSHISVGAILCGQVKVGRAAFVGANATVIQNRTVNVSEIIPAGVTKR